MNKDQMVLTPDQDGFSVRRLAEVLQDGPFMAEVAACYRDVFNARGRGEWAEDWTLGSAHRKLFVETAADADRSWFATWRVAGRIVGFCVTYADRVPNCLHLNDLPPDCRDQATLDSVIAKLAAAYGPDALVLQYREIGIRRECRSGIKPVATLILLPGYEPNSAGASKTVFWTSTRSRLYPIVTGIGLAPLHRFGDAADNVLLAGSADKMRRRLELPAPAITALIAVRLAFRRRPRKST